MNAKGKMWAGVRGSPFRLWIRFLAYISNNYVFYPLSRLTPTLYITGTGLFNLYSEYCGNIFLKMVTLFKPCWLAKFCHSKSATFPVVWRHCGASARSCWRTSTCANWPLYLHQLNTSNCDVYSWIISSKNSSMYIKYNYLSIPFILSFMDIHWME